MPFTCAIMIIFCYYFCVYQKFVVPLHSKSVIDEKCLKEVVSCRFILYIHIP